MNHEVDEKKLSFAFCKRKLIAGLPMMASICQISLQEQKNAAHATDRL